MKDLNFYFFFILECIDIRFPDRLWAAVDHIEDPRFVGWLVVLGLNATLTAKVISWRSVTHMFPGILTPVVKQLFFPKPPTTFLTCFCRGERRKYSEKKVRLNRGSNSQPPGQESDKLTTEPPGLGRSKDRQHGPVWFCNWSSASQHITYMMSMRKKKSLTQYQTTKF